VRWWQNWKDLRALPYGGSDIMDQPAFVLEAVELCEATQNQIEAEERQRQRDQAAREERKARLQRARAR